MKKINRTYIMGVLVLAAAAWIGWQTYQMPTRFVSNEPGPKLFPYLSAIGMGVCAILSMIFEAPKDAKEGKKIKITKQGWLRMGLLLAEFVLFALGMNWIGFWITSMVGTMAFFYTLKGEKKINSSTLYPYDFVHSLLHQNVEGTELESLQAQWTALPDYLEGSEEKNCIVQMKKQILKL